MSEKLESEAAPAHVPTAEQPAAQQPAVAAKSEQGGVALIKSQYVHFPDHPRVSWRAQI
jgi:hypothetical protein